MVMFVLLWSVVVCVILLVGCVVCGVSITARLKRAALDVLFLKGSACLCLVKIMQLHTNMITQPAHVIRSRRMISMCCIVGVVMMT
jgi:arginine exporter protein ArgO